ncbi:nmrA-like family protein [Zymoseptoria brevis]|uniref:NmrA-like family protein n=1 Tax=Zymoseptoria brevis TaxID=1047168 RepID=A0A0F4GP93_9PEZI|nr:nmrA-like family protein [Zymoseptoria brevis]
MGNLAILGASGKLGFATLNALLEHNLIPSTSIIVTSSSPSGAEKLKSAQSDGVQLRSATFDDESSLISAFEGCDKLFLISSPRISKDFNNAPPGQGREEDHFRALQAAKKAGVKHVYYTSLAFANPSLSEVMTAHERTEDFLTSGQSGMQWTILRQGLYNESWPLYFGHWKLGEDDRGEVVVGGDGKINWTSIADLGLASTLILAAPEEQWVGKTVYLSQGKSHSLKDVAGMVGRTREREVKLKVVERKEHENFYVEERGIDRPFVEWWSRTYDALRAGECAIEDGTLESLLATKAVKPKALEDTIREMLA